MSQGIHWTPTERRILDTLSDCRGHRREELVACLADAEMGSVRTVHIHINAIRKKLRAVGENIIARQAGTFWVFFWVRSVGGDDG